MPLRGTAGDENLPATPTLPHKGGGLFFIPHFALSIPALIWLPAVLVAAAMLLPTAYLVLRAASGGAEALGLLASARAVQLLLQTGALAVAVTVGASAIGASLAWLTTRTDLPLRRVLFVLLVLPLVIPTYVGAFAYIAALGPRGLVQQMLAPLGVQRLPEIYGFGGTALVLALATYPYVLLTMRSALLGLDPSFEQASRSLGVGPVRTLLRITLPLLRPSLTAGALLVALYTLSDFGAVSLLRFDSFTRAIYLQYQGSLDRTMAAVLALILVVLTAGVLIVEAAARGRARYYRSASGVPAPPGPIALGRLRWAALGICFAILALALFLPAAVLVYWVARGLAAGVGVTVVWTAAANSVSASALAAAVTLLAAFPVAVLAVRHPGRFGAIIERITYSAFALPGIVVALALVFFAANYTPLLYQTLALLVLAYLIRFLPEAVGSVRSALLQVSPRLEEAARSLGRGQVHVLATITAPLIGPGALAGVALVFLSAMKELPATLLLSPIGFKTLATVSWNAAAEGLFAQAALPALLLLLLSAAWLPVLLYERRGAERVAELPVAEEEPHE